MNDFNWKHIIGDNMYGEWVPPENAGSLKMGYIKGIKNTTGPHLCPGLVPPPESDRWKCSNSGYGVNWTNNSYIITNTMTSSGWNYTTIQMNRSKKPTSFFLLTCSGSNEFPFALSTWHYDPLGAAAFVHGGRNVTAYLDGHVESNSRPGFTEKLKNSECVGSGNSIYAYENGTCGIFQFR